MNLIGRSRPSSWRPPTTSATNQADDLTTWFIHSVRTDRWTMYSEFWLWMNGGQWTMPAQSDAGRRSSREQSKLIIMINSFGWQWEQAQAFPSVLSSSSSSVFFFFCGFWSKKRNEKSSSSSHMLPILAAQNNRSPCSIWIDESINWFELLFCPIAVAMVASIHYRTTTTTRPPIARNPSDSICFCVIFVLPFFLFAEIQRQSQCAQWRKQGEIQIWLTQTSAANNAKVYGTWHARPIIFQLDKLLHCHQNVDQSKIMP